MKTSMKCIILLLSLVTTVALHGASWSRTYHKEVIAPANSPEIYFEKVDIPSFSQLLLSWNAVRPELGHFSFEVQAREQKTKKWSSWHHISDWGARIQKSYCTDHDGLAQNVHVRFEIAKNKVVDGFRIRVKPQQGAVSSYLKGIAVTVSDFSLFKPERIDERYNNLRSVHIKKIDKISQLALDHPESRNICSPTSCTMLTRYLAKKYIDPIAFASGVYDSGLKVYGSWPFNIAHAFEHCDGLVWFMTARLHSFLDIYKQLTRQIPVVVSVRGYLPKAPKTYDNGHLLVVIGYDAVKRKVICHDPAFDAHHKVVQRYPLKSFLAAWERSHRLAYWAEPKKI